jgi:hypothetical protein
VPVPDLLPEARFRRSSSPAKGGEEINLELAVFWLARGERIEKSPTRKSECECVGKFIAFAMGLVLPKTFLDLL